MAAVHKLDANFKAFFGRINPSLTYQKAAASAHAGVRALIEDKAGPAGGLRIHSYLQGSYDRDTAIHTINDVDVVALCATHYQLSANRNTRNQIFDMIAQAIRRSPVYGRCLQYTPTSMCLKVALQGVKVEVLPALRYQGPGDDEPFYMFDPDDPLDPFKWRFGYAQQHQQLCSNKNHETKGNFIPSIKCLKHMRFIDPYLSTKDAVSFHIECLLYRLASKLYDASVPDRLEALLSAIAEFTPEKAETSNLKLPTGDRRLFGVQEWAPDRYRRFHGSAVKWAELAKEANSQTVVSAAIRAWQQLLGKDYFPEDPR